MAKALLVIDLQEGYIEKYPSLLLDHVNERLPRAAADNELIVFVKNTKWLRSGRTANSIINEDTLGGEGLSTNNTLYAISLRMKLNIAVHMKTFSLHYHLTMINLTAN